LLFIGCAASAQRIDYPAGFARLLESCQLLWQEPLDAGYRDIYQDPDGLLPCNLALRSAKENLEIRLKIIPWNDSDPTTTAPHVIAWRALTHVAINDEHFIISGRQLDPEQALHDYGTNWAIEYFFTPKPAFGQYPYCKMVALAREGVATALVFFLFDDVENPALESRKHVLTFKQEPGG
jgi:hypothetical protein